MKEPIFVHPMKNFEPGDYFLYWIAAIFLGICGIVNRKWTDDDDKWWEPPVPKQEWSRESKRLWD